ncbi:MAG: PEP-CTERM sorting domain-containing protein [Pirellulales bacterium]|nr:PEP-CTERM sorting domain-containing protein [Pirellulales bacterium]
MPRGWNPLGIIAQTLILNSEHLLMQPTTLLRVAIALMFLQCVRLSVVAQEVAGIPLGNLAANYSTNYYSGSNYVANAWDIQYGPIHVPAQVIVTLTVITPLRDPFGNPNAGVPVSLYGFPGNGVAEPIADASRRDYLLVTAPAGPRGSYTHVRADATEFFRSTVQSTTGNSIRGALGFVAVPAVDATGKYVGGLVNFWERDGSIEYPFLPASELPFTFVDVPSGWVDPPTAPGFTYTMISASLFTEISDFPTGFANEFAVSVNGVSLGTFGPGELVDFRSFPGGGVTSFTVAGIQPLVDPSDPLAFPLKLGYNTPLASFTMVPIPEPSSFMLAGIALVAGIALHRRLRWERQARD